MCPILGEPKAKIACLSGRQISCREGCGFGCQVEVLDDESTIINLTEHKVRAARREATAADRASNRLKIAQSPEVWPLPPFADYVFRAVGGRNLESTRIGLNARSWDIEVGDRTLTPEMAPCNCDRGADNALPLPNLRKNRV